MLQFFYTSQPKHTHWFRRLLHNITFSCNSKLPFQWNILLALLNLPYYFICVSKGLKHRNFMHTASQWLTERCVCSVSLSILKAGNASRMQVFNKFDESRKILLLEKRNSLSILYLMFLWTKKCLWMYRARSECGISFLLLSFIFQFLKEF